MERSSVRLEFEQVLSGPNGRMIVLRQSPFLFAAVNHNYHASLLIRASLEPSEVLNDGHGFAVRATRTGTNDYVQITSTERGIPVLFVKLVEYILERISTSASTNEGTKMLRRSIDEYRLFASQPHGRLSEGLVRGILAEMMFLREIVELGTSVEDALKSWRGPWSKSGLGLHDFVFPNGRGVEIKSTRQPPVSIRVSSHLQLVPMDQTLDLLILPLEVASSSSEFSVSFRDYALETGEIFRCSSAYASETWDSALNALLLDLNDEWYDRYSFVAGEWLRYQVKEGFPHLDISPVPSGIENVRYSLNLMALAPFAAPIEALYEEIREL